MGLKPLGENEKFGIWRFTHAAGMQDFCLDKENDRWVVSLLFGAGAITREASEDDQDFQARIIEFVRDHDFVFEDGLAAVADPSPGMGM